MDMGRKDMDWVTFSVRLYWKLLLVYPPAFREEYGSLMVQVFEDHARMLFTRQGMHGLLTWWGRTMLDTAQAAIEEHTQRGVDMSKEKFKKLSGWALVLSGSFFFLGWLAGSRPEYSPYDYYSLSIDKLANAITTPLLIGAILLLVIGFLGLLSRYGEVSGAVGRTSLVIGALSGVVSAVGAVLLYTESPVAWSILIWGLFLCFGGMAVFGVVCLSRHVLPYWKGLPFLAGIWLPTMLIYMMIAESISGDWVNIPGFINLGVFLFTSIGLAGVGYLLQQDSMDTRSIPAAT